ncbi:unnamed protein product [Sympodiomycopsis kandeliae]
MLLSFVDNPLKPSVSLLAMSEAIPLPRVPSSDPSICAVSPLRPWPYHAAPSSLSLLQVHYYIRHGERTPVRSRLIGSDPRTSIPTRWNFCHTARQFRASVLSTQGYRDGREFERGVEGVENQQRTNELMGECLSGELTDLGRLSTLTLGRYLKEQYMDQLQFISPSIGNDEIYIRSTNMSRTIESAQQVIHGLLSGSQEKVMPRILIRNGQNENLLPNTYGCHLLNKLDQEFSKSVATLLNPSLEQHDRVIAPEINGINLRIDSHPRLSGILDTVRAANAHGIPIPAVFQQEQVIRDMEHAVCSEWFHGYNADDLNKRKVYRRLAMGPLLNDLSQRLQDKAANKDPLKMAIYSTHDTTLAGILSTLDCFNHRWPAFTASIGVELYRDQQRSEHYVRMLYNGNPVSIPACQAKGNHLDGQTEFCTLNTFVDAVKKLAREDGMGWDQECGLSRSS